MSAERVILDARVIVSALLVAASTPGRVLDDVIEHGKLVSTDAMQRELTATLLSAKFDKYTRAVDRQALLDRLEAVIEVVPVIQIVRVCRDPRDDVVLEAALNGRADVVITGDKDLLALHPFRGIAILTPADYLAQHARK